MAYERLILERGDDGVAVLTVNRPDALNALDAGTMNELERAIEEVAADDAVRVLIVTGAGEKAFVSGADIGEIAQQTPTTGARLSARGQRIFRRLETMGKPSIAAVNGYALGGGLELAMACSLRVAADTAKLGLPEVTLGVIPGYAGTQRLPRIVGRGVATEMILTGRALSAEEALRVGLVSQVVPRDELLAAARKLASRILRNGPLAIRAALQAIDAAFDVDFEAGCRLESSLFGLLCDTADMREGVGAFLEKRRARFEGK